MGKDDDRTLELEVTQEQLRRADKTIHDFKAALDEHAIVAITDPEGVITYVNEKFCAISQYSEEELLGQDHRILNSNYHPREFFRDLWETIKSGRVWHGDIRNRRKDGSVYWVNTTIVPFLDGEGNPERYIAVRADISECKELERLATEAAERERIRIGQDLHDDLCQKLAALKLKCGMLREQWKQKAPEDAEAMQELAEEIGEAAALSRRIARGLSPVSLEADGLMVSLQELANLIEQRFEIPCQFDCPVVVELRNRTCASHLFRIAQELLNNAAKHARPSRMVLGLYQDEGGLRLEVCNDGMPFRDATKKPRGMGLHFMQSRADAIGASLEFLPGPTENSGTRVVCLVPQPEEDWEHD